MEKYFEYDYKEYEKSKLKEKDGKVNLDSDVEWPNKRQNQICAGIFAATAMLGYAISTGIVQVFWNYILKISSLRFNRSWIFFKYYQENRKCQIKDKNIPSKSFAWNIN